jgi:aspartyl protease family protein
MFRILHFTNILLLLLLSGCSGCSQSGKRGSLNVNDEIEEHQNNESQNNNGEKTIVKMEKIGGVYQIPVMVNDVKMYFIFDTGASTISISETEAGFLWKQGKLTRKDIVGTANFSDANGDISEGTIILLKTIKIGRRTLNNVEASVVHNLNAPLLFGQSALGKFGKISIDNNKKEITFE